MRKAIEIASTDMSCSHQLTSTYDMTWAIRFIPSTTLRLAKAKTYANLQALHLRWFVQLALPFGPWLPYFAIAGFSSLIDKKFIRSFNPSIADKLEVWPLDPNSPLDLTNSVLAEIVIEYLGVQVLTPLNR
jgi:hypothetical protein